MERDGDESRFDEDRGQERCAIEQRLAGYPAARERAIVETMRATDFLGTRRRGCGDRSPPARRRLRGAVAALCVALPSCGTPGVSLLGDEDADARDDDSATDASEDADDDVSCTFTVDETSDGGSFTCRIEPGSLAACTDVAECICRARSPGAERVRIDECIGAELTPRAMITLSDFCPGAPARYDLDEALRGYYGSLGAEDHLRVSAGCTAIPALAGPAPYAECVLLSGSYCRCIPGICDADILVRRRCADLSREQVLCIHARLVADYEHVCELDLAAIVADCIDPAT
jgi:hypothetical protein